MAFDQSAITDVRVHQDDAELLISWSASSLGPFQVYLDNVLIWSGSETSCTVPWPSGPVNIEVGAVDPGEEEVGFAADLPAAPETHATLSWIGGTYLDEDLAGFRVYQGPTAGAAVSYTTPVAEINAYPLDIYGDGFGLGGFGEGGFGAAASRYSWRSGRLNPGLWNFGVKAFDEAGNEGPAATTSISISGPPRPPAADGQGLRLRYTYNAVSHICTLTWLASPA